jgi:6-phosphogluconolactonase
MNVLIPEDPAAEVAGRLARAAEAAAHIALTGGSSPAKAYEKAAELGADWSGATLWWGDERCVPPDDELSNYGMAKRTLLDRLPGGDAGPTVKRIKGEAGPHAGADDYERELRETLGEETPRLDLILLGLGPDAHVASLFPGQPTLEVRDRLAVGVEQAGHEPYVPRVSLTMPVLNAGREVLFLVTGAGKAEAVRRAFVTDTPSPDAPGSMVRPADGELTLVLDEAAAPPELRSRR